MTGSPAPWFEAVGITKAFDGIAALRDFSCSMERGEIVGLIGPNGAGKTTLFNVVSGLLQPDAGDVIFEGRSMLAVPSYMRVRLGIVRTFQDIRLITRMSVLDNVLLHFQHQPGERLSNVFWRAGVVISYERRIRERAMELLEVTCLSRHANSLAGALSYGQQKLLGIAALVASDAALMLFDEPVAGVSPALIETIIPLLRNLCSAGRSALVIEHDFHVIEEVCDRAIFMEAGAKVTEGSLGALRRDRRVLDAYLTTGS